MNRYMDPQEIKMSAPKSRSLLRIECIEALPKVVQHTEQDRLVGTRYRRPAKNLPSVLHHASFIVPLGAKVAGWMNGFHSTQRVYWLPPRRLGTSCLPTLCESR